MGINGDLSEKIVFISFKYDFKIIRIQEKIEIILKYIENHIFKSKM